MIVKPQLEIVIAMDSLRSKLYTIYVDELLSLNIGYSHDKKRLQKMMDIISSINYIKFSGCIDHVLNINNYYEN